MDNTLYTIEGDRIIVDVDNCGDEEYMDEKNWMARSSVGIMCHVFMPISDIKYTIHYKPTDKRHYMIYSYRSSSTNDVKNILSVAFLRDIPGDSTYYTHRVRLDFRTDTVSREQVDIALDRFIESSKYHTFNGYYEGCSVVIEDSNVGDQVYTVVIAINVQGWWIYENIDKIVGLLHEYITGDIDRLNV